MKYDKSCISLYWHNTPNEIKYKLWDKVVDFIFDEIEKEFLTENAEDLIFHHIPLTEEGYDGPCVFVWGEENDALWHCEYVEKPEWLTLQEIDEIGYIIPNWYTE